MLVEYNRRRTSQQRGPACPSHSGGIRFTRGDLWASSHALKIVALRVPAKRFVPNWIVAGRSVLSRSVRQFTPRTVVSSWIPPESVSTIELSASRDKKSR